MNLEVLESLYKLMCPNALRKKLYFSCDSSRSLWAGHSGLYSDGRSPYGCVFDFFVGFFKITVDIMVIIYFNQYIFILQFF